MKWHELKKLIAVVFALSLVAAACGGSDSDGGSASGSEGEGSSETTAVEAGAVAEEEVVTEVEEVEGERTYGGTVTIGLEAEATGLRPWEDSCSSPCLNMQIAIFDKLIEQTAEGTFEPFLAETLTPSDDLTVWTMTLRSGVEFHNGVPLTAQTIVDMYALQQEGAATAGQIAAAGLLTVEASGDLEVTYTLASPNAAFPAFLSKYQFWVFEPAAAAADPDGFSIAPVGTGPFMIEKRDLDNETVVVRNDSYWLSDPEGNQLPFLDSIVFKPIPDEGARLDSLLSGTTNAMQTLRQGTIRDTRAAKDGGEELTLYEFQGNNTGGGMFNVAVAPFDDLRVRMGLTLMNDQSQVIEALGGTGISLPATQWFSPDSPWWSQKVADAWPQFDFPAGQAMLQTYIDDPERSDGKAVGEPIDVELSCPPDPTLIAAMQVIEQAWTGSGLANVTLTNFDQQTHINNALGLENGFLGVHQAHCWRWGDDTDPAIPLGVAMAPWSPEVAEAAGVPGVVSPQNFPNWFDEAAFTANVAASQTTDFEERKALYETVMMRMAEEVPVWYSGHTAVMIATEANIFGLNAWHMPDGALGVGLPNAEGRWAEVWIG